MSAEDRERYFFIAQALCETDRTQDMVKYVKKAIDINPVLTLEERNVLVVAYKTLISTSRKGLRELAATEIEDDDISQDCKNKVILIKSQISKELISYCNDIITLLDEKILPANKDAESQVFCIKLKGDYYRYIAEVQSDLERDDAIEKGMKCYKEALEISKAKLEQYTPTALGLILNYTVFLFEIVKEKDYAITLATETYNSCIPLLDQNSEKSRVEAVTYAKLLNDNVKLWLSTGM